VIQPPVAKTFAMGLVPPNQRRLIWSAVLLAVVVRLIAVVYFRTYDISAAFDHWTFGYEEGRIARSLVTGEGYSSPFSTPSGPTALLAPGFPFLLAAIFKVFGIYTTASAVAVYFFNALVSALTCVMLYGLGARIFGQQVGLAAAFLFALYPPSIWYAGGMIWDTSFVTFALVVLMYCLYSLPPIPPLRELAWIGVLMGFMVLLNPAPASFYPAVVVWVWHRLWQNSRKKWFGFQGAAILTLACFVVCVPWMIRNAVMVGEFAPRSVAALNFWIGNNEEAWKAQNGGDNNLIYPGNSQEEEKRYDALGEAAYDRYCAQLASDFIRRNPQKFADLTWYRFRAWWFKANGGEEKGTWKVGFRLTDLKQLTSLALVVWAAIGCIAAWRNRKPVGLMLVLVLIYPIPYYLAFVSERYRFPIEPFLLLFATFGLAELASAVLRTKADRAQP
jgi:4-amino-4-deoxy-L-arabinose transferase-like glycosyltransferase